MFTADPQLAVYKRAAGVLAVSTADPQSTTYSRAAGALEVFTVAPQSTTYKNSNDGNRPYTDNDYL
ncbi:hypothetical protein EXE42_00955 [Halorubrum sp. SP3]|nr:hypothetical protein EXE42_00955 [Halorubrum sp. SP3]